MIYELLLYAFVIKKIRHLCVGHKQLALSRKCVGTGQQLLDRDQMKQAQKAVEEENEAKDEFERKIWNMKVASRVKYMNLHKNTCELTHYSISD